jgi:hypothetical protein
MISVAVLAPLLLSLVNQARLPDAEANRVVDAIYRVEGGAKAKAPFGVLSVRVSGYAQARRVCFTTVQNTHDRWLRSNRHLRFLDFLADRYCPPSCDPKGNRNWNRNIHAILSR